MTFLLFLMLYMLPVLPVARRIAYTLQKSHDYVIPPRSLTQNQYGYDSGPWKIVNSGNFYYKTEICQNCGGDKDYHPGQQFASIRNYQNRVDHQTCLKFESWDGERNEWPEMLVPSKISNHTISASLVISTIGWIPFSAYWISKNAAALAGINGDNFAVAYGEEKKSVKIERLQREIRELEAELKE